MATLPIDREAWAAVVRALIQEESAGNITQFAETVGVDRKTVTRWLAQNVAVSPESVHAVASVLGKDVTGLMLAIGYYQPTTSQPAEPVHPALEDPAIAAIRASDLQPSLKRDLVRHFTERLRQDEQQRLAEAQQQIALLHRVRRRTA